MGDLGTEKFIEDSEFSEVDVDISELYWKEKLNKMKF